MVDCGTARCLQERKDFKKELLSWSRKIPLSIGLESVAARLAGKLDIAQLFQPWSGQYQPISAVGDEELRPQLERFCNFFCTRIFDENPQFVLAATNADWSFGQPLKVLDVSKEEEKRDWTPPENCFYCSDKLSNHPMRHCVTDTNLELSGFSDSLDGEPLDLSSTGAPPSPVSEDSPAKTPHVQLIVPVIKKSEPKPPKRPCPPSSDGPSSKSRRSLSYRDASLLLPRDPSLLLPQDASLLLPTYENDWDVKLKEIRRKHNLNGAKRRDTLYSHAPYPHELSLPFLPELIRKMAAETLKSRHDDLPRDLSVHRATEPLDLKIPSSLDQMPAARDLDTYKDSLAKSLIGDKIRARFPYSPGLPPLLPAPPLPAYPSLQTLVNGQTPVRPEPAPQARKPARRKEPADPNKEPGKKGSRPKRGQYRKYNNQLLVEAVKAVQRGEMSVHRAGSYFGVPHSTLEYKVKERHLLRKKKKEAEKAALAEQQAKEGKDTPTPISTPQPKPVLQPKPVNGNTTSPSNNNNTKIKNLLSPPFSASPLLANPALFAWPLEHGPFLAPQMLLPGAGGAPLPGLTEQDMLYPPGFAMTAPASEMLKKLQQKAASGAVFPGMIESADDAQN